MAVSKIAFASSALLFDFRAVEFTAKGNVRQTLMNLNQGNSPLATSAAVGKSLVWASDLIGATCVGLTFRHTGLELVESFCGKLGC